MARVGSLTCRDAIEIMGEFLEAALGSTAAADLERHLEGCDECAAYLNTYRKTRALTASTAPAEMPAEVRTRLRAFLLARLSTERPG